MGTRGFITFVVGGAEKTTYNHSDSYPEGLGLDTLRWLRTVVSDLDGLREQASQLRVVDPTSIPTEEDQRRLAEFANTSVSNGRLDEWYVLLRRTQGEPGEMLRAGVIEDASEFPLDSLFAEWGYVVDLDVERFEVYRGFQHHPHDKGRFAAHSPRDDRYGGPYYPVALVASWPLAELPSDDDLRAVERSDAETDS